MIEMTEADWMTSDTDALLRRLGAGAPRRKIQLFACACFRQAPWHTSIEQFEDCLLMAERHADAELSDCDRQRAMKTAAAMRDPQARSDILAHCLWQDFDWILGVYGLGAIHYGIAVTTGFGHLAAQAAGYAADDQSRYVFQSPEFQHAKKAAREQQAPLVRDIFGRSFYKKARLQNRWRTSTAVGIALQMYESRNFNAMPILADALQDAGCDDDTILNHCRSSEPHVRGCWVVDLVLGKK